MYLPAYTQVIVRHGDRTRASGGTCWAGDDVTYQCTLTQLQSQTLSTNATSRAAPQHVYDERFVANQEVLPGNCGLGQLTARGFQQHIGNGQV